MKTETVLVVRRTDGTHEVEPMPFAEALAACRCLGFTGGAYIFDGKSTDPTVAGAWIAKTADVALYMVNLNAKMGR